MYTVCAERLFKESRATVVSKKPHLITFVLKQEIFIKTLVPFIFISRLHCYSKVQRRACVCVAYVVTLPW